MTMPRTISGMATFLLVFTWPFWLGLFLLGTVAIVVNWRRSQAARGGAVALVLAVALLFLVFYIPSTPYTPLTARLFYEGRRADYNAVAEYILAQGKRVGLYEEDEERIQWPEEIRPSLDRLTHRWTGRTESPYVHWGEEWDGRQVIVFFIWSGNKRDSGDGGYAYDYQYLAYVPGGEDVTFENPNTERLERLTGDWYLYTETLF